MLFRSQLEGDGLIGVLIGRRAGAVVLDVNIAEIESRFHGGGDACGVPDVDDLGYVD